MEKIYNLLTPEYLAKKHNKVGSVFRIKLKNNHYCFGMILPRTDMCFFDYISEQPNVEINDIINKKWLFYASVSPDSIDKNIWKVISILDPLPEHLNIKPAYFLRNSGPDKFQIDKDGILRDAKLEELIGLEVMSAWSVKGIEERLFTYYFRTDLYDAEYGCFTFELGKQNNGQLMFGYVKMQEFYKEGVFPFCSPVFYYNKLENDEEKLAFVKKSFDRTKGWDLRHIPYLERTPESYRINKKKTPPLKKYEKVLRNMSFQERIDYIYNLPEKERKLFIPEFKELMLDEDATFLEQIFPEEMKKVKLIIDNK